MNGNDDDSADSDDALLGRTLKCARKNLKWDKPGGKRVYR